MQSNNVSSIGTLSAKTYAFLDAFGFVAEIVEAVPVDQQAWCFDLHEVAHYVAHTKKQKAVESLGVNGFCQNLVAGTGFEPVTFGL